MENTLKQLKDLMGDTYKELLEVFLADCPTRLEKIHSAFQESDMETVAGMAHAMKGSSSNLGAQDLSEVCAEIERLARNNSVDRLAENLEKVGLAYQEVKVVLERELAAIL